MEQEYRVHREIEGEKVPTALKYFRDMVLELRIARRQVTATAKRESIEVAKQRAIKMFNAPVSGRGSVVREFTDLRDSDPHLAQSTLRTLRSVDVLNERALRRFLNLPVKGRIFPRNDVDISPNVVTGVNN